MTSREKILQSVREHLPPAEELPTEPESPAQALDLADRFAFHLEAVGGKARFFSSRQSAIDELGHLGEKASVRDVIRGVGLHEQVNEPDITIVDARLAVAENGAVFVTDQEVENRNILFLGQKLIALVPSGKLVSDMHEAYAQIDLTTVGFGIFIAGPSATADIAQILVRGAHGPSQMEVWFYDNE